MITVILDTNILHQEGLYSRSMQLLGRLAASGELQMSVPELVKKEFISKRVLDSRERLQGAHAAFGDLAKKLGRGDPIYDELTVLEGQVTSLRERIAPALENAFEEWVKINKVLVIKFNPEAITEVFDDYFAGTGAYRRPKCREDIPDAIVSSCIRSLVKAGSGTHVVVRDGVLKKHLLSVDGLTVSDDLTEYFAVAEVRALIERLDAPLKDVEELKAFLAGQLFRKRLSDFLSQATDLLEHVYVEEEAIDGISNLEIDCFGVSVNYAQTKSISAIDYGQVTYIDKGRFAMEIKINTVAAIHYCADYGDYFARSDEVEEVSMNSDGISDLRENRMVILRGYVEVLFDATLTARALEICTRNLAADSSITIELSIDSASIL